jgi:two-component system LytT family sensor kinase
MVRILSKAMISRLNQNTELQFWLAQFFGWSVYSLVTFFALTVWDDNVTWSHVLHIAVQALMGILCSWPLRPLCRWAFDLPIMSRLLLATSGVLALSWAWTASRMTLFMWISGERGLWQQFNDWYFGSLFVFISWTAIYIGMRYYGLLQLEHDKLLRAKASRREEQLKRLQAEAQSREAQLRMLRYQLNPHFLFNTLNALNSLVRTGESEQAGVMIDQLSSFLRHALDADGRPLVSLDEEMFMIRLYLEIERARFQDRLRLEFNIEPSAGLALVPSMILQPLIENAMKYAIADSENGGTISIEACVRKNRLILQVSDSGPGMDTTTLGDERGIGLSNTLNRLETLFASDYAIEALDVKPSGLCISMDMPLQFDSRELLEANVG